MADIMMTCLPTGRGISTGVTINFDTLPKVPIPALPHSRNERMEGARCGPTQGIGGTLPAHKESLLQYCRNI
jgi:hypothetical protein